MGLPHDRSYLYIDVGGGSTELVFYIKKKKIAACSFPIGSVRLLQGLVSDDDWKSMRNWIANTDLLELV